MMLSTANTTSYGWSDNHSACSDAHESFALAYALVAHIDDLLTRKVCHFWDKQGRLLTKLDQVVTAILTDQLAGG